MASQEEPRVDDTRGLPGALAPESTTADQEKTSRQEAEEQAAEQAASRPATATADRNGEVAPTPGPSRDGPVVSPARPRGMASFPGGPPPVVTPVPDLPTPQLPEAPLAGEAPRFRVTTIETTAAASRPAGPPPPARRRAPAPLAAEPVPSAGAADQAAPRAKAAPTAKAADAGTAEAEATAQTGQAESPVEVDTSPPAETEGPEVGATGPEAAEAAEAEAADVADEGGTAVAGEAETAARPAARRRRRGRSSRSAETGGAEAGSPEATPAAERARAAAATPAAEISSVAVAALDAAATEPLPAPAGEALPSGTMGRTAAETEGDDISGLGSGSARTRARRRRRAAAKARLRGPGQAVAGQAGAEEAADAGEASGANGTAAAPAAVAAPAETPPARTGRAAARAGRAAAASDAAPEATPAPASQASKVPGRRRQRGPAAPPPAPAPATPAVATPAAAEAATEQAAPTRTRGRGRRRLTRTRAPAEAGARTGVAEPAPSGDAAGERSTRLEAATRARGVRQDDRGRRRRTRGLTEEQKRSLRDGLERRMLVTEGLERTQIGVLEGGTLVEHYVTRKSGRSLVGNIYLGRVQNVLPGMEAAFVDIGRGRNAVLYAGEVNYSEEDLDGEAPRIEKALKPGQAILVQVTKDPIGAKGARLTNQVSLAGRYLVLQPEDSTFGISRRLPESERVRLREILKEVRPKGLGLIVRTAAEGASADDLRADLARLQARWEAIERKAKKASPPVAIYQEPELVVRVIRDIFSPDFVELVVDAPGLYERVKAYLEEVAPDLLPKVRAYDGRLPLFEHYRVSEQIHKALERKVWLPSGGSLVIDQTEAMTVIDVNTGKYVGKSNLEETVVATNLEAAEEIVRQLRLRDIGGIIIIDFIDMLFEKNQQAVVDRLRAALAKDKTKSQVMEVSSLGLVQMTRKRVSGGLLDSFSETCPTCEGRGVVITHEI
jgi:ribonuclease E